MDCLLLDSGWMGVNVTGLLIFAGLGLFIYVFICLIVMIPVLLFSFVYY